MNTRTSEHEVTLIRTPFEYLKAVRCIALYGANASGKSNILKAMRRFSRMVSESQRTWNPTGGVPLWDPFLLDESSREGETSFELDFLKDSKLYVYGFRFNRNAITQEWLRDETARSKTLFSRRTDGMAVSISFPGRNLGATLEESRLLDVVTLQTRANSLFLSCAAQSNHEMLASIYKWITDRFHILSPNRQPKMRSFTADSCSKLERKAQVQRLLLAADTGIVDFQVAEEEAPDKVKEAMSAVVKTLKQFSTTEMSLNEAEFYSRHDITMMHRGLNGKIYPLPFDQESAGTRAFFDLLGPILNELDEGSVLLIDDLESSLHPTLARQLVQMFNDSHRNPHGAQLVFATHDVTLLDLELMRRDQFCFAEKDGDGATHIKPLSEFKPRKGQNVALAYLHGRFGGTPFVDEELIDKTVTGDFDALLTQDR